MLCFFFYQMFLERYWKYKKTSQVELLSRGDARFRRKHCPALNVTGV
jgi:hypothetical protein